MERHSSKNVGIPKGKVTRSHNIRGGYAKWYVEDYAVVRRDNTLALHRAKEVTERRERYGSSGQVVGIKSETQTG
jgi:hypothetical protein